MNQRHPTTDNRIAFVQSCWHRDIVDECRNALLAEIVRLGFPEDRIDVYEVPGVFEIPLEAKVLAQSRRYAAIVAAGFVVDGGIYRHEFVSETVIAGLMQVQLATEIPVISAVLTPQAFHEHDEHRRFFREHFLVKGAEAASACWRTLGNIERIREMELAAD